MPAPSWPAAPSFGRDQSLGRSRDHIGLRRTSRRHPNETMLGQGLRTDYFVNGEPTELELGVAHTSSVIVNLHTRRREKIWRIGRDATIALNGQCGAKRRYTDF